MSAARPAGAAAMPAEDALVTLLVQTELGADGLRRLEEALAGPLRWSRVLEQAAAHGVLPLVHRSLARRGFRGVPDGARAALIMAQQRHAARNAVAARQLAAALAALGAIGVDAVPLKGVGLAERLYGSAAARAISDLDVLVRRPDVARAIGALLAAGYGHDGAPFGAGEIAHLLESDIELALVPSGAGGLLRLELHWDIAWRWRGDQAALDDLWACARPAGGGAGSGLAMSPEWEVLYLAVHAARHRWAELKWLVDVHEIVQRGGVDWRLAADTARRFGWLPVLRITLGACQALFGTAVADGLAPPRLPPWLRLFPAAPAAPGAVSRSLLPLRLFPGPAAKLRYLARLVLRPTLSDRRLVPLPRPLEFLYRPIRVARLGTRWLRPRAETR